MDDDAEVFVTGIVGEHLAHLQRRNLRPGTIDQRRRSLRRFARHIHPRTVLDAQATDVIDWLDSRDLHAESRATEISHLRGFYKWAQIEGLIDRDPLLKVERPKLKRRLPRPFATGDLHMGIDLAPERIRPWLMLAAYAGLRACEIGPLRGEHLWWDHHPPMILVADGKGGQEGVVAMGQILQVELSGRPRTGWLFPRRDGLPGPTPAHLVSQITNRYLHSIGIDSTLHQARHWFGTHFYQQTKDFRLTQETMRHLSPASTVGYTLIDGSAAASHIDALPTPNAPTPLGRA